MTPKIDKYLFPVILLCSGVSVYLLQWHVAEETAIRWTLWAAVAAVLLTAFLEYQKRQSEKEKDLEVQLAKIETSIKAQVEALDLKIQSTNLRIEAHERIEGHDGVFALRGRIAGLEAEVEIYRGIFQAVVNKNINS